MSNRNREPKSITEPKLVKPDDVQRAQIDEQVPEGGRMGPDGPEAPPPSPPPEVLAGPQRKQRANSAYIFSIVDGCMVWNYPGIGVLRFDPNKASATNRARAMMYGWKQRINDGAALDADASGKVDPKAKFAEQQRLIEHYESGAEEWALKERAPSGPASMVTQALVALGKYQGVDVSDTDKANAFVKRVADTPAFKLDGQMGKARTWLEANSKQIREKIAELRAAAQPAIDADAELAKLMAQVDEEANGTPSA